MDVKTSLAVCSPCVTLHFGGAHGRADGECGGVGGWSFCSHLPLCQQLVTVATSKMSLSLIYTVAGSGVFQLSLCGDSPIFGSGPLLHSEALHSLSPCVILSF